MVPTLCCELQGWCASFQLAFLHLIAAQPPANAAPPPAVPDQNSDESMSHTLSSEKSRLAGYIGIPTKPMSAIAPGTKMRAPAFMRHSNSSTSPSEGGR